MVADVLKFKQVNPKRWGQWEAPECLAIVRERETEEGTKGGRKTKVQEVRVQEVQVIIKKDGDAAVVEGMTLPIRTALVRIENKWIWSL